MRSAESDTSIYWAACEGNQLTYPTHHQSQLRHVCSAPLPLYNQLGPQCSGHCYAEEEGAALSKSATSPHLHNSTTTSGNLHILSSIETRSAGPGHLLRGANV